jgi:hypothetical protein
MRAFSSPDGDKRRPPWRAWVCVLLIGLLLYNPFLALTSATHGRGYQALTRHRASVGASEMQHFAPVQVEKALADVRVAPEISELPEPQQVCLLTSGPEHLPLLLEGMTSHWFRPPPRA